MPRPYLSVFIKRLVVNRANGYCEYCYVPSSFVPDTFPLDHIEAYSLGGLSEPENLAQSCTPCNGHKYDKTYYFDPLTNQKTLLFHPRKDYWPDHFRWSEDKTLMIEITPKGRATAELLDVNREANVNLRKLLIMVKLHPPKFYPED